MKFAMIVDHIIGEMSSFQVIKGKSYDMHGKATDFRGAMIDNECAVSMWTYPWLYENSYFINWKDYMDNLPDLDLDLIFLAIERCLLNPEYSIDKIRKQYPNAKIVGWIKEVWVSTPYDYEDVKYKARLDFLDQCDLIVTNRPQLKEFEHIQNTLNKKVNFVAIPVDVDFLHKNYYKEKDLAMWAYLPNPIQRRGTTYEFAKYISEKYDVPIKYKPLSNGQSFNYMSQKEFIENWSSCAFHLNLDPIDYFPGNQCALVAATGTINIGGVNDYHHLLYPKTSTCDWKVLEKEIASYINNPELRNEVITNAWEELNKTFSFEAVRKSIKNILTENK